MRGRAHTDFEPIGLQLGNFILHSGLNTQGEYNDNIFLDNSKTADEIARLKPSLSLDGEVSDVTATVSADAEIARYLQHHTENYEDFNVIGLTTLDITDESNLALALRRARIHVPRGSVNDPGRAFGPLQYNLTAGSIAPRYSLNPFIGYAKLEGQYLDYLPSGPTSNAAQTEYRMLALNRVGYQVDAGWSVFVEPSYQLDKYVKREKQSGNALDSQKLQGLVGFTYDATADAYVDLGVGYFQQLYWDGNQPSQSGLALNGSLTWNINELMTLTGALSRTIQNTPLTASAANAARLSAANQALLGVTSQVTTTGKLRLDYEADDNILTFAGSSLEHDEYTGVTFTEDVSSFEAGVTYLFNEYLSVGLTYNFLYRDSPIAVRHYDDNRIMLEVTARM